MKKTPYSIKKRYHGTFREAVNAITQSLSTEGFGILTTIDVQETLKKKLNKNFSPYVILGACNPPNAYKALRAEKEIGLLLPCNIIVYTDKEDPYISIMKPTAALTLSNNSVVADIAKEVEDKLIRALDNAVKV